MSASNGSESISHASGKICKCNSAIRIYSLENELRTLINIEIEIQCVYRVDVTSVIYIYAMSIDLYIYMCVYIFNCTHRYAIIKGKGMNR